MPVEIREILFLLPEFQKELAAFDDERVARLLSAKRIEPKNIEQCQLIDVVHTRRLDDMAWERKQGFLLALGMERAPAERGLMILTGKRGFWGAKQTGFFLPDRIAQDVLIAACRRNGIGLPRRGRKETFARDLMVGLRINLNDTGMELALA